MRQTNDSGCERPQPTHMASPSHDIPMSAGEVRYVLDKRRVALVETILLLACMTVAKVVASALSIGEPASEATRKPETSVASDIPIALMGEVTDAAIPMEWEPSEDLTPKRVAHQKNSQERMDESGGFYGIEVDLRGSTGQDDYKLYHDDYHGYTLRKFLSDCRERSQMAILDVKYDADPEGASDVVSEMGMLPDAIFQTASGEVAERICQRHPEARCWLLNGAGDESELRAGDLTEYAPYLEGVNICGTVVGEDQAKDMIDAVHAIKGHDEQPLSMCIFAYGARTDVYGNDDLYAELGVEYLMTDFCPEGGKVASATSD